MLVIKDIVSTCITTKKALSTVISTIDKAFMSKVIFLILIV